VASGDNLLTAIFEQVFGVILPHRPASNWIRAREARHVEAGSKDRLKMAMAATVDLKC
jgi:hypothetical protein